MSRSAYREYMADVIAGAFVTSGKIRKLCKILSERGDRYKRWHYDQSRADHAVKFIEAFCCQTSGEIGKKLSLEPFQRFFISAIFGWVDDEGNRQKINWRTATKAQWKKARWDNGMSLADVGLILPDKTIVCGHHHCSYGHSVLSKKCSEFGQDAIFDPYYSKGIIAFDACTAYSGKMNCLVLEDEEI